MGARAAAPPAIGATPSPIDAQRPDAHGGALPAAARGVEQTGVTAGERHPVPAFEAAIGASTALERTTRLRSVVPEAAPVVPAPAGDPVEPALRTSDRLKPERTIGRRPAGRPAWARVGLRTGRRALPPGLRASWFRYVPLLALAIVCVLLAVGVVMKTRADQATAASEAAHYVVPAVGATIAPDGASPRPTPTPTPIPTPTPTR